MGGAGGSGLSDAPNAWLVLGSAVALSGLAALLWLGEDGDAASPLQQALGGGGIPGFQVPLCPLLPAASVAVNIYLLISLGTRTWVSGGAWLALGVLVYALWGAGHATAGLPGGVDADASDDWS